MDIIPLLFRMIGGLCMFLFGMNVMSDGIQKSAGDKLRRALNFITDNRFAGVLTGIVVTAVIQSSSAVTVMVVSFVNAGLLTLAQSIGVIMGANIGTTVTAWVVSLVGFSLKISSLALPAIGIGFILSMAKWKHRSFGEFIMGFGILFMGLHYLTEEMSTINTMLNLEALSIFADRGVLAILIGAGAGIIITMLLHSSSATTAIVLTMAFNGLLSYQMAAAMILGANIGTTIDAVLASLGAKVAAKRTALVHVLFNFIGTIWALFLLMPLLELVDILTPGESMLESTKNWTHGTPLGFGVTAHLAMLHTVFNSLNTLLFLPFVKPFARFVSFLIPENKLKEPDAHYVFASFSRALLDTPELNIIRVEKEIRDMAGVVSLMFARFSSFLQDLHKVIDKENAVVEFCSEMKQKENYVDEMREILSAFLIECTRKKFSFKSERRVSHLLRNISDIEEMSDECYGISCLLERSVRKRRMFKQDEIDCLVPYLGLIEASLNLLQEMLGQSLTLKPIMLSKKMETGISKSRKKLQKLSRKRIEAGEDVQTELLFIDLVRRIEKLGDYCINIAEKLSG